MKKYLKQYWYVFLLLIITLGLGFAVYFTSQRIAQKESVAPSAPKAVVPACTLQFTIQQFQTVTPTTSLTPSGSVTITRTPTPSVSTTVTLTPTPILTNSPTLTPSVTSSITPTNTPVLTMTRTATPTTLSTCNSSCTVTSDCQGELTCYEGLCRNSSCVDESSCQCSLAQAEPSPIVYPEVPVSGNTSTLGLIILLGGLLVIIFGLAL